MCARCKYPKGFDQQSSEKKKESMIEDNREHSGGGAVGALAEMALILGLRK